MVRERSKRKDARSKYKLIHTLVYVRHTELGGAHQNTGVSIHCELTMASTGRAYKRLLLPSFLAARAGDALRWARESCRGLHEINNICYLMIKVMRDVSLTRTDTEKYRG